jgi:hypothetical protein
LQGLRRAARRVHEELCWAGLQDRVSDVLEVMQKVSARVRAFESKDFRKCLIAALTSGVGGLLALNAGFVAAENLQKLSGVQIRAKFTGMQLTDEVHYRLVYERGGALRSVAMGVKKRGKWVVDKDHLCLYLEEPDDGCYEVTLSGKTYTLTPAGLGLTLDGILQPISDPQ